MGIWPPLTVSVNGLFTETDGIMGWVGAGGGVGRWPRSTLFLIQLGEAAPTVQEARWRLCDVNEDRVDTRQVCKSNSRT